MELATTARAYPRTVHRATDRATLLATDHATPCILRAPSTELMPRDTSPARDPAFTLVLPVYNEERALSATIAHVRAVLDGAGRPYELLIVDDGSRDDTPRLLDALEGVRVIRHPENRGYGAALKTGILAATCSLVAVMDVDGTYPPEALPSLLDGCAVADMAVGARVRARAVEGRLRSFVKWCFRLYARWITNSPIPDLNSGIRAFHRPVVERFLDVLPDGFSFTTTITVGALVEGLVVRFEPVDYMPRIGVSKLRPVPDTFRIGRQLLRLGLRFAPLRTLVALGVPLATIAALTLRACSHEAVAAQTWRVGAGVLLSLVAVAGAAEWRARRRRSEDGLRFASHRRARPT